MHVYTKCFFNISYLVPCHKEYYAYFWKSTNWTTKQCSRIVCLKTSGPANLASGAFFLVFCACCIVPFHTVARTYCKTGIGQKSLAAIRGKPIPAERGVKSQVLPLQGQDATQVPVESDSSHKGRRVVCIYKQRINLNIQKAPRDGHYKRQLFCVFWERKTSGSLGKIWKNGTRIRKIGRESKRCLQQAAGTLPSGLDGGAS